MENEIKNKEIDFELEQPKDVPALADNTLEGSILGKFANVDELCRAYENLQTEFTRKSQILADLQQGKACEAIIETPKEVEVGQSREEIIKEYLTSVATKQKAPAVIAASNDFAFVQNEEPKSIRDVSHMAEEFFRRKS